MSSQKTTSLTNALFGGSSDAGVLDDKSPFDTKRALPDRPKRTNYTKVEKKKEDNPTITPGGKKKRRKLLLANNNDNITDPAVEEKKEKGNELDELADNNVKDISDKEEDVSTDKAEEKEVKDRSEFDEETKKDEITSTTIEMDESTDKKKKETNNNSMEDDEEQRRTIFVGNLPSSTSRKTLASMFKSCGAVASARIRSLSAGGVKLPKEQAGNQNLAKKVAVNTNNLEKTTKKTIQGYVVFESETSIPLALKMNGSVIDGTDLVLRVDHAKPTIDSTRSVFVGNLPYRTEENTLRRHFIDGCGMKEDDIENVRVVRDSETMQCKGFGYILFKEKNFIPDALKLNESEYMKRTIRVNICGKRVKGKRGKEIKKKKGDDMTGAAKRVFQKSSKGGPTTKTNKKTEAIKKRGIKHKKSLVPHKASGTRGISKRKSSSIKVEKRVKKIQKRITKGMGKAKK